MSPFRMVVASDNAGFEYKAAIMADLQADPRVVSVEDVGVFAGGMLDRSYPDVAIAANKVAGIRATVAHAREWLGYEFDPSSASNEKVALISSYEACN